MKALKVIPAIVLLSFIVVSQKANSQTLPKIELKLKPQIEKLQVDPIQTPDSREDKQTAQIYLKKGIELFKAEKFNEAIQAFGEVIKIQPNNQYAYLFRGLSYFQLKQYQQAKANLDKSIELDSSISYAYLFRGFTNYQLGNKENAITDLQTATSLFENDGDKEMAQKSRNAIERIRNT